MDVPHALLSKPNWILWRNENGRKIPYQADGRCAKSNDATTWDTYLNVLQRQNGYTGLGYVFDGSGLFGIDLDGCVYPDGVIAPWAAEIIQQFSTTAEFSPSGTGVHLYGLGTVGAGRKTAVDATFVAPGKQPGIEVYDRGRYFAFTGRLLPGLPTEPVDCQAALDKLIQRFWPAPKSGARVPAGPRTDIAERAARYLATIPGAVSGCGGHNATFRVACVLILGFGLRPEAAFPLLAEWNEKCEPPWSEKELWHKLGDADKKEGSRGWLLEGRTYDGPDVDLLALLSSLLPAAGNLEPAEPLSAEPDVEFPRECIEGMPWLMRLAYDYAMATAIKPQPILTLSALIAMFGAVFGRKVRDDYGTRTNIMMLALSPSGSGKEHPRQVVKEILFACGQDLINGPERIGSHAGIISSLDKHPVRLFQLDEIGRLLHTMREPKASHLYNIGTVLMQLYSSAGTVWTGDAYADLNKVKRINQPCLCLFGTSVPEGFYTGLTAENLSDGLLARMLVVESDGHVDRQKPQNIKLPDELVNTITQWCKVEIGSQNLAKLNPCTLGVSKTSEADARHEQYCNAVNTKHKKDSSDDASIWARAPEKAAKLALIYACCEARDCLPTITLDAINWGRKLTNYATRLVIQRAGEKMTISKFGEEKERAWKKIKDGMTVREFQRKTRWLRPKERVEILGDWVDSGIVSLEEIKSESPSGGRPSSVIRVTKCH